MDETQNKYKQLIEDETLYNQTLLFKYRTTNIFWETESWQKRELAFRHFTVCILLANTEFAENVEGILKAELEQHVESLENPVLEELSDDQAGRFSPDPDYFMEEQAEEYHDENETERAEIQNRITLLSTQAKYRYVVIEGHASERILQTTFLSMWEAPIIRKKFDIIDTTEKKLVEVKVSVNTFQRIVEYDEYKNEHTSLVVCDPNTTEIHLADKEDRLPGEAKVRAFLAKRKIILHQLGLIDERYTENVDLEKMIYGNSRLNSVLDSYKNFYMLYTDVKQDLNMPEGVASIENFTCSKLFQLLDKPTLRVDRDPIQWKGKLIPVPYKKYYNAMERDSETIDSFFNIIEGKLRETVDENINVKFLKWLTQTWDLSEEVSKNFHLFTVNKRTLKQLPECVTEMLGIGKKMRIQGDEDNMKQDEFFQLQPRRYHRWFEDVYLSLSKEHTEFSGDEILLEMDPSTEEISTMKEVRLYVERLMKRVGQLNIGAEINEIENFYSRLGIAYNSESSTYKAQSSIVVLPINVVSINGERKHQRRFSGICVRGPQHSRSPTDRINIVTLEFVKDSSLNPFFSSAHVFPLGDDLSLVIRRNSIKKVDSTFLAFSSLSMFMPINLLGDMVFASEGFSSMHTLNTICHRLTRSEERMGFFIDRVIDSVLMAVVSNSRDEGYFSMLRKLFMILLAERRSQVVFTLNVEEFCEKINECLIDNPFSMFKHNTILYILAYKCRQRAQ